MRRIIQWVRGFSTLRLIGGALAALFVAALLAAEPVSGQLIGVAVQWWSYPTIGVAALRVGVIVSSFISPKRGAELTVCEVGPVLFGVGAAYLGSVPRASGTEAAAFLESLGAIGTAVAQPALAGVAILILGGAVVDRARRERYGAADPNNDDGEVCGTCTPLVPGRAGAASIARDPEEEFVGRR